MMCLKKQLNSFLKGNLTNCRTAFEMELSITEFAYQFVFKQMFQNFILFFTAILIFFSYLEMCDFSKGSCGWTGHASVIYLSRYMLICGRNGELTNCILKTRFQDGDTWTPRQIGSINYIGKI